MLRRRALERAADQSVVYPRNEDFMNAKEIIKELKSLGNPNTVKILRNHGITGPAHGVKVADLKKIQKRVKQDHQLALDLFATGNYDAMYLAGLIADDRRMTKKDLRFWARNAGSLTGSGVPWVAAGSKHGWDLGREWIDAKKDETAAVGWNTIASLVSITADEELDLPALKKLLRRVQKEIHKAGNESRHAMNHFVICLGCHVASLKDAAIKAGEKIGPVDVDHGKTSCKTPYSPDYIRKVEARGTIGRKRKSAKC